MPAKSLIMSPTRFSPSTPKSRSRLKPIRKKRRRRRRIDRKKHGEYQDYKMNPDRSSVYLRQYSPISSDRYSTPSNSSYSLSTVPALSPSKNTPQVDADDDDPQSICSPRLSILDEDIDRLSDNINHQSRFFSRSSSLCSSTKIVSSRKSRQQIKLNDTTKTHQYNDTSTNLSPTVPQPRSPRLHSPRLTDLDFIQPESNGTQRNLDRINYCELDTTDPEQLFSLTLDNSSDAAAKINTDQDTICWEHFIRGRLSLSPSSQSSILIITSINWGAASPQTNG